MAGGNYAFKLFDNDVCRAVVNNIFVGKSYPKIEFLTDVGVIADVGANIGAAAIYFAVLYPEARVLAFEPAPENYALLVENTASFARVETFPFALFDADGEAPLYAGGHDPSTSSIGRSRLNTADSTPVTLKAAGPFLDALGAAGIDILKLDTEGCEVPILRSLGPRIAGIKAVYVEYHSDEDRRAIDDMLSRDHVLSRADAIEPHRGELCYVARRAFPSEDARDLYRITR